ncbi:MAG: N-acetylmuramoyl-L-alanine amidase [Kordiimonadaceae bacterium]|jgi:N-acetylmuramoyl-L-alanine amidase|nr:N-acetylmuramoyl-L-alanine amidase [Kordiimonadaceae bacterium]MBT6031377.1 N-acetylmuramoyl-L-alanine amidase [Kordiimonadaceae bacterium]
MKNYTSPNFNQRTSNEIKYLILHYTGMATGKEALERLCDESSAVSAHYLIEEDGEVFSLVDEENRAWHSGVSCWEDDADINDLSIGIEIVNSGHPYPGYESVYRSFPDVQMNSVIKLSQEIITRHNIKPWHILGHSDVAWQRKIDPGELFNWKRLAEEGVGLWPKSENIDKQQEVDIKGFLIKMATYGYDTEKGEEEYVKLVSAFQRHFRQNNIDGAVDPETVSILDYLLEKKAS